MDETDQAIERSKQTEQMGCIVNELDSIQFSIKASQLVKEIRRKILNPNNKDITDISGLAPPAQTRRLLYLRSREHFD
ncbi:hypothetical protein HN51_063275 [Arachis hypogaea]|uniref:Uncharacterized protein n=1 Tax=Arachis hypogaea TaxID=3818 RepID=A0A445AYR5_ARAHY|nr:hypothetical protein Ahy_B01g056387 [Arachis hypogaea]